MFAEAASGWTPGSPAGEPDYRERVLREVHHRVKNHLQILQGLVRQEALGAGMAERRLADRLVQRLGAMAAIYKAFQDAADGSAPALDLLRSISEPLSTPFRRVSVVGDPRVRLGRLQAELACMLVSEAVCNSLEHAFLAGQSGRVEVGIGRWGGAVRLTIEDDGVGFDAAELSRSNGLRIMKTLAAELGGRIMFHSPPSGGTRLVVTFPAQPRT